MSGRALELAYRYLSRRERTVAEVHQHLCSSGLDDSEVDSVIGELVEQGYLDDARFARLFVEDKRQLEQWGSERIRRGLASRGIERDVAEAALAAQEAPDSREPGETPELTRALTLLRRRFAAAPPRDRGERERALGMLLRKGYEPELALEAIRAYRGE